MESSVASLVLTVPTAGLALLVVAAGWFVARLARRGVAVTLEALHFDEAAERSGVRRLLLRHGFERSARSLLGALAGWTLLAMSLATCAELLGVVGSKALAATIFAFGFRALLALVVATFALALAGGGLDWADQLLRRRR